MRNRWWWVIVAACGVVSCGEDLAAVGAPCPNDEYCESGMCHYFGGPSATAMVCTVPCDPVGSACGAPGSICRESSVCGPACSIEGGGCAAAEVCRGGVCATCASLTAAEGCEACGCGPYGGGVCVPGTGCQPLAADGEPCTADEFCMSGACDPSTDTCITPRADGEPCSFDVQCDSGNCSTDGDTAMTGVCNQELGTPCREGTCSNCVGDDGIFVGICSRERCDPDDAPNCPPEWRCVMSTDGVHRCFETCPLGDEGLTYRCVEPLDFCTDGFCS